MLENRCRRAKTEDFSVCWSSEKAMSSGKQMQASKTDDRQMGMIRTRGKDRDAGVCMSS